MENNRNMTSVKKHKILDRPILSVIVLPLFATLVLTILSIPGYMIWGSGNKSAAPLIYQIVEAFMMLVITEAVYTGIWFKGEFEGTLKGKIGEGFRFLIPVIVVEIILFIYDRITGTGNLNSVLNVIALSVTAGIVEEVLFRSLILSNLMRITRTYRQMIGAVFASSLLFSVSHLTNLLNGADPGATVSQLISAACFGVFLAGIYLSCGSIIPCMAFHFGHDVLALLFLGINESGATVEKVTMVSNIENMIVNVLLLALGFMLLRSRNFEEIRRLWDEKWHIETDRSIDAGEISASESVRRQ